MHEGPLPARINRPHALTRIWEFYGKRPTYVTPRAELEYLGAIAR